MNLGGGPMALYLMKPVEHVASIVVQVICCFKDCVKCAELSDLFCLVWFYRVLVVGVAYIYIYIPICVFQTDSFDRPAGGEQVGHCVVLGHHCPAPLVDFWRFVGGR